MVSQTDFSTLASSYTIGTLGSQEKSPGPLAYWKFDEGQGSVTSDSVSNHYLTFGTGSSAPSWATEDQCVSGKCLYFNGNNYLASSETFNNVQSVSFWVNPKNATQGFALPSFSPSTLLTGYTGSNANYWIFETTASKRIAQSFQLGQTSQIAQISFYGHRSTINQNWTVQSDIETDNAGIPSGTIISTSDCMPFNNLDTANNVPITFNYSTPPTLTGNTTYHVVFKIYNDSSCTTEQTVKDTQNYVFIRYNTTNTYTSGNESLYSSSDVWTAQTGEDVAFSVTSTNNVVDIGSSSGQIVTTGFSSPTIYINGILKTTLNLNQWQLVTVTTATPFSAVNPSLGQSNTAFATAYMDNYKLYSYQLTANQVKAEFNSKGITTNKGSAVNLGSNNRNSDALSQGLVGYWKLDENIGTSTLDSSGNNNTAVFGTGTSAPSWASGKFGIGLSFNTNDYASIGNTITISSFSLWYYPTTTAPAFLEFDASTNIGASASTIYTNGISSPKIYIDGNPSLSIGTTNTWHHLVVTTSSTIIGSLIKFGKAGSFFLNGQLDDIHFYNRTLSPLEVQYLYGWAPGPIGYWNFNENNNLNNIANDISGSNNPFTLYGPLYTAGKYGSSLKFNGTSSYGVTSSPLTILNGKGAFTVSAWINPTFASNASTRPLRHIAALGGSYGPNLNFIDNGTKYYIDCSVWNTAVTGINVNTSSTGLPTWSANTWHYYTCRYTGSIIELYWDGQLLASSAGSGNVHNSDGPAYLGSVNSSLEFWSGLIDDLKIYDYPRTQKQIIEDMNAGHPAANPNSMLAYYKFDEGYGSIANNSTNNGSVLNGTLGPGSSAPTWTNNGKFGRALSFSSTNNGQYVSVTDPADGSLDIGISQPITLSTWFKLNSLPALNIWGTLLTKGATNGTQSDNYMLQYGNAGGSDELDVCFTQAGTGTMQCFSYDDNKNQTLDTSRWHHLVFTYTFGIASSAKIYYDGILKNGTWTAGSGNVIPYTGNDALWIGNDHYATSSYEPVNGLIDEVKIYNYALTSDEIKLDYNNGLAINLGAFSQSSGSTAPVNSTAQQYCIPGDTSTCLPPVGEWNFDEGTGTSAYDSSGNGGTGTLLGTTSWATGKIGKALSFDGSSGYVSIPSSTFLNITGDITIEAWAKPNLLDSNYHDIIFKGTTTSNSTRQYGLRLNSSNNWEGLLYTGTTANSAGNVAASAANANRWDHVVMVRSGTIMYIYINGKQTDYSSNITGSLNTTSNIAAVGRIGAASGEYFPGLIDNVKIFNYARTPAQIAYDYNRGGALLWYKLDECQGNIANDASGNNNSGTITIGTSGTQGALGTCNNGTGSTAAWGVGSSGQFNSSLSFDGTDDYLSTTSTLNLSLSTISTVSFWLNWSNYTNNDSLAMESSINYNSNTGAILIDPNSSASGGGNFEVSIHGTGYANLLFTRPSAGVWHHYTFVIDSSTLNGNITAYVDGKLVNGTFSSGLNGPYYQGNYTWYFMSRAGSSLFGAGKMDDIRIFNYGLTKTQIQTLYNQNFAARFAPTVGKP